MGNFIEMKNHTNCEVGYSSSVVASSPWLNHPVDFNGCRWLLNHRAQVTTLQPEKRYLPVNV
jgi:hypothetical protein